MQDATLLDREARLFARYLVGWLPDEYVLRKYREAHAEMPALRDASPARFDALLASLARRHVSLTRLCDAYARVFHRRAHVRVKLVVLLAILECAAASHGRFDPPAARRRMATGLTLVGEGLAFLGALAVAAAVLGPLHRLLGRGERPAALG